eukprot:8043590-Lingulodinium_polyedra.AAC.1
MDHVVFIYGPGSVDRAAPRDDCPPRQRSALADGAAGGALQAALVVAFKDVRFFLGYLLAAGPQHR